MTKLVIVESPTKARTIRGYLPKEYHVEASMGHIRDLPASAAEQQWIQTEPLPNSLERSANGKPIATQPSKVYVAAHP